MKTTKANVLRMMEAQHKARTRPSAWTRGVYEYAREMLEDLKAETIPTDYEERKEMLLNGASSWDAYSWGGCALIMNEDIAERLCTPSELKKCRYGERRPNNREEWLDVQARALLQASGMIGRAVKSVAAKC